MYVRVCMYTCTMYVLCREYHHAGNVVLFPIKRIFLHRYIVCNNLCIQRYVLYTTVVCYSTGV